MRLSLLQKPGLAVSCPCLRHTSLASSAGATVPITAAAKSALFKHFKDKDWKINILLPKGNAFPGTIELVEIVNKFNLKRDQVARQLRNYKNELLGHTQVNILLGADDLRQRMRDSLSFYIVGVRVGDSQAKLLSTARLRIRFQQLLLDN
jgi:hypothetical protein